MRGGKSGSRSPKRVSGGGSAPPRFRFGFPCCSCLLFRGVCLAAASAASRTCLCQAHATVPNKFFICFSFCLLYDKTAPCGAALEVNVSSCFFRPDSRNAVYIVPIIVAVCFLFICQLVAQIVHSGRG